MSRITLLALVLALPPRAHAEDHLVPLAEVQTRMETEARGRAAALIELEAALATQPAEVRAGLALLGDDELQDLRHRANVLRTDPAAAGAGNYAAGFVLGALAAIFFWLWVATQLAERRRIALACLDPGSSDSGPRVLARWNRRGGESGARRPSYRAPRRQTPCAGSTTAGTRIASAATWTSWSTATTALPSWSSPRAAATSANTKDKA